MISRRHTMVGNGGSPIFKTGTDSCGSNVHKKKTHIRSQRGRGMGVSTSMFFFHACAACKGTTLFIDVRR